VYRTLYLLSLLLLLPLSAQAVEQADPMRPDDYSGAAAISGKTTTKIKKTNRIALWVQSIQIAQGERNATINGKLLKIGDKIRGAQLVAIEHDQVRLRKGGELIKLMFLPRTIKR